MDSSVASEIPPASAVTVTVAVVPARLTTTPILLPAVSATQVAEAVMSQSEPSITRNSSVS